MRYHGPGWTVEDDTGNYQLWAPQNGEVEDPHDWAETQLRYVPDDFTPRAHWAGCWRSTDPNDCDFQRGETMDDVLTMFPRRVAAALRGAVESQIVVREDRD